MDQRGLRHPSSFYQIRDRRTDVRGHFFDTEILLLSGTKNDRPTATAKLYDLRVEKEKEERNRLLYVAMTRAETWLIVAGAGKVQDALNVGIHKLPKELRLLVGPFNRPSVTAGALVW